MRLRDPSCQDLGTRTIRTLDGLLARAARAATFSARRSKSAVDTAADDGATLDLIPYAPRSSRRARAEIEELGAGLRP